MIEYDEASAEVRAVYDDIMRTRGTNWINNFWKALANDPPTLRRTWESIKEVMAPGALDPLTKELVYLAVSASNGCAYCIASHAAAAKQRGHDAAKCSASCLAVVGMANETNSSCQRLSRASRREVRKAVLMGAHTRRIAAARRAVSTG